MIKKLLIQTKNLLKIIFYYSKSSKLKNYLELLYWKINYKPTNKTLKKIFNTYCRNFNINKNSFKNQIIVDIGCGPRGTLHYFNARKKIGIDPLINKYKRYFSLNKHNMTYLNCKSEKIPLKDNSVDAVISFNALDHVDSFQKTISEIYRILKKNSKIYLQLNLRKIPNILEPQKITYKRINNLFKNRFKYRIAKVFQKTDKIPYKRIIIKGQKI